LPEPCARFLFLFEPQAVVPTTLAVLEEEAADDAADADAVDVADEKVDMAPPPRTA